MEQKPCGVHSFNFAIFNFNKPVVSVVVFMDVGTNDPSNNKIVSFKKHLGGHPRWWHIEEMLQYLMTERKHGPKNQAWHLWCQRCPANNAHHANFYHSEFEEACTDFSGLTAGVTHLPWSVSQFATIEEDEFSEWDMVQILESQSDEDYEPSVGPRVLSDSAKYDHVGERICRNSFVKPPGDLDFIWSEARRTLGKPCFTIVATVVLAVQGFVAGKGFWEAGHQQRRACLWSWAQVQQGWSAVIWREGLVVGCKKSRVWRIYLNDDWRSKNWMLKI